MFRAFASQLRAATAALLFFTALTGLLYPAAIAALAQGLFPSESNGSLIRLRGRPVGSALIGQSFRAPGYFWGRPSATPPEPCNAASSSGSNLGPSNPDLGKAVAERIRALRAADPGNREPVPADLATASASGLDPHIRPEAAFYQAPRVARARGMKVEAVRRLIEEHVENRQMGILGEPRVNVLRLNLALDTLGSASVERPAEPRKSP